MIITLKTLDHRIFKYEVSPDFTVNELKSRIEDDLGKENIYRLIFSGQILKDDQLIQTYKINEKQFVVLMITKPQKTVFNTEESCEAQTDQRSGRGISAESKIGKSEDVEERTSKDEEGELIGLDWVEDQINEKAKHFVTHKDFR